MMVFSCSFNHNSRERRQATCLSQIELTAIQRTRRPWITRIKMMMMAKTNKMWMNPPIAELVTKPRAHKTMRITAIVINMVFGRLVVVLLGVT